MQLGIYLRQLARSKLGLAISLIIALLAAAQIILSISFFPPGVERRSVDVGSASTQVLVDTPRSTLTDLRQDVYELRALSQRAVLIGNIMVSPPVRGFIAQRSGVPVDRIAATGPLTPDQPRAVGGADTRRQTSDILKRPDGYRLSVRANPAVPVLNVYAQAPDGAAAVKLANGAVDGLQDYLDAIASQRGTPAVDEVQLQQLGRAQGGVINAGAGLTIALLVFVLVFVACCAAVFSIAQIRRGWAASQPIEQAPDARSVVAGK